MRKSVLFVVLITIATSWPMAYADVLIVTNTDDSGPGSLRQCIEDALPADEIHFDPSLDGQPIVLTGAGLMIEKDLTITGNGPEMTILDGNDNSGVLFVEELTSVVICGVTVTRGYRDTGGGIKNEGTLILEDCVVRNNRATTYYWEFGEGGGIWNSGTLTISRCTITQNYAEGSDWGDGGGVYNRDGTLAISHTSISGNSASDRGGGLASHGILEITKSTVSGNKVRGHWHGEGFGGGLSSSGPLSISHSTISGNSVEIGWHERTAAGGGLLIGSIAGEVSINDSTISGNGISTRNGNYAETYGGNLYVGGPGLEMLNTIIAGYGDCYGDIISLGHNIESGNSCNFNQPTDLPNTDPMLSPLQDNWGPT